MYIYIHIFIYMYVCVCVCVCVYYTNMTSLWGCQHDCLPRAMPSVDNAHEG